MKTTITILFICAVAFLADANPTASFTASPTTGPAPLAVTFTDNSTGSFTNEVWNFFNGNRITNNTGSPANETNIYTANGTYAASLIVRGIYGVSTNLQTLLVTVTNFATGPDYTYSTNLYWSESSPTLIFAGTNGTDPGRDTYIAIWNKDNANTLLLERQITQTTNQAAMLAASVASNNVTTLNLSNTVAGGLTTNLQFVDGTLILGAFVPNNTNTLWFTNGLLKNMTSP